MLLKIIGNLLAHLLQNKNKLAIGIAGMASSEITAQTLTTPMVNDDPLLNAIIQIIIAIATIVSLFKQKNKN